MLNSGEKKSRFARQKKKYSNSCVRKKNSEKKLNGRSLTGYVSNCLSYTTCNGVDIMTSKHGVPVYS